MKSNCKCGQQDCCCQPQTSCCDVEMLNAVGYIHNRALDKVAESPTFPSDSREVRFRIIANFVDPLLREICAIPVPTPSFREENALADRIISQDRALIQVWLDEGFINSAQATALYYLLDTTRAIRNIGIFFTELDAYASFTSSRRDLSSSEKSSIMVSISVAKSASAYWENQFNPTPGTTGRWTAIIRVKFPDGSTHKPKWWDILGAVGNCIGCSAGGAAGCIGCAALSSVFVSSCAGEA